MEDKEITITLKTSVWNIVIANLANGRYAEVASIISMIQEQARSQIGDIRPAQENSTQD